MQNLLEEILEKNAKSNNIDPDLIHRILEIEQEFFGTDSKIKLRRQNKLVALLKENLKK